MCIDGQYLASRLSKSITQQSSQIKGLLRKFNSLWPSEMLTWADVTDVASSRWLGGGILQVDVHVSKQIKLDAIKHHHLLSRCDEELLLLKEEMHSTMSFYLQDWQQLLAAVVELESKPCTQHNNGALACLQLARLQCEGTLRGLVSSFSKFVDFGVVPVERFMHCDGQVPREDEQDG